MELRQTLNKTIVTLKDLPGFISLSYSSYDNLMTVHIDHENFIILAEGLKVTEEYHTPNNLVQYFYLDKDIKVFCLVSHTDQEMIDWYFEDKWKRLQDAETSV